MGDPERFEAIDIDVRDAGLRLGPGQRLAAVVEAPLVWEPGFVGDLVGELASVVRGDRDDAGIVVQAAPNGRRGDAAADDHLSPAIVADRDDRQVEVSCHRATLGRCRVSPIPDEDLVRDARRCHGVGGGHPGRGGSAK
jgi:hypothetical protein